MKKPLRNWPFCFKMFRTHVIVTWISGPTESCVYPHVPNKHLACKPKRWKVASSVVIL